MYYLWLGLKLGASIGCFLVAYVLLMSARQARRCAWCQRVMRSGGGPVSHGICDTCFQEQMVAIQKYGEEA